MKTLKQVTSYSILFFTLGFTSSVFSQEQSGNIPIDQENKAYKEIIYGDLKAPVTIFEYASLTCNHCASFHTEVLPKIKEAYIDKSLVKLVYRDYPLDGLAMAGAMLARCAPSGRGKAMLNLLFNQQLSWITSKNPIEPLKQYSKFAGMNENQVDSCLKNEEIMTAIRTEQEKANNLYTITSTPTFFIEGVKVEGNMGFKYMAEIIDEKLSEK